MFAWLMNNGWHMAKLASPPTPPKLLPPPPAPPTVSDAVWPEHTSCLCGPGMPRIQSGAQQDNPQPPQPLYTLMLQYMERSLTHGIKSFCLNL